MVSVSGAAQSNRFLQLDSPFGVDKVFVQRLVGGEGFSQLFEYQLSMIADPNESLDPKQIIGKAVTVSIFHYDGKERHVNGFVSRFEYLGQDDHKASYVATVVPWLWFLKNRTDCRIFQNKKTPDIIKEVFDGLGFTDYDANLSANYEDREYCVQYRETDFDFVCRLMEEEGILYYFKHEKGKHTLVLADSKSAYFDLPENQLEWRPGSFNPQFPQLETWRHGYDFRPGKVAMTDYDFKKPSTSLMSDKSSSIGFEKMDKLEIYDYPGRFVSKGVGRQYTQIRMEELEAEHDVVNSSSNYLSIATGGKFTVSRHRNRQEEGKQYVVSWVQLEVSVDGSYEAGTESGESVLHNEFQCIPANTVYRPARHAPKPVVEGPQTAVIVGPAGEEIYVDEFARVKAQFHWDRLGKKDQNSSCWIRVSQVHAGKGWGMIDIPRIGEEVIVSFLEGDPDQPIITGRVYNGENKTPYGLKGGDNSKNKMRRGNTTKSYKEGTTKYNEMTMDDTPGEEQIRVHAQYNMDTVVEHDQTLEVGNNETMDISNDQSLTVGNNRTHTVGSNETITISSNQELSVGSKLSETVGSNRSISVGMDKEETIGMNLKTSAGGEISFTAGMTLKLQCGASSITLTPASIDIKAPLVTISGGLVKINC